MEDIYSGIILYLIGFSGAGKKTIASEIVKLTDMKIIDHLLIFDLLFKIIKKDEHVSHKSIKHIHAIKETLLDIVADLSAMQESFILTDELFENKAEHRKTYNKVKDLANKRGSTFIPVIIQCSLPEIVRRYANAERSKNFKPTDTKKIKNDFEHNTIIQIRHENLITIDVSGKSASESAKLIIKKIKNILI
jgi:tRNA uridine 5-carbamoylmethylation protein Kti12